MNSAKNAVCETLRTQTKVRIERRAGMPDPGRFGASFFGLAGAALGNAATPLVANAEVFTDSGLGAGTAADERGEG
jgi:hypothetical protein